MAMVGSIAGMACLCRSIEVPGCMCRRIHVRPFPQPLGDDGALPLLSSNADTFHAANAHRGTIVKDCYFVNAGGHSCASI